MPMSVGGDRIKFHKPKPPIHPWLSHLFNFFFFFYSKPLVFSQLNREHPIVFREELQDTLTSIFGTHIEEALCYLT